MVCGHYNVTAATTTIKKNTFYLLCKYYLYKQENKLIGLH